MGVILVSLLTAISCQTEEVVNNDIQSNNFSLTVNMGPESRTYIDENNKSVWGDNEKIYVTSKDGKTTGVLSLTQKSGDGTSATFSGFVFGDPADLYYSVYPVPENGVIDITHIDGANHNAPMAGVISNGSVAFDYACGLVCMEVEGADEMTVSVVPTADNTKQIAGSSYTFNPETGEWNFAEGESITINIPENDVVYIPVNGTETKQTATLTAILELNDGTTSSPVHYQVEVVEDGLDASSVPEIEVKEDGSIGLKDADTSWYKVDGSEFIISTTEQFRGFVELAGTTDFSGKTIKLATDINLANVKTNGDSFAPIGSTGERDSRNRLVCKAFKGTFDGEGHTIKGIYQSGWDMGYEWGQYGSIGLFATLESATVKNLIIDGMEAQVEGGDISFIAGSATGNCVFENVTIKNSSIGTYNNGCGGIIGWSGAGTYTFKDITLESDVVLGGLWGSFDSSIGGVVGQAEPGATYNFENVTINCRIDAYNDCTASYDYYNYRMCGMIIGRCEETTSIDGRNYPDLSKYNLSFNNVVVNYGNWMNYHYCEPTPGHNGGRGMRVEPGYAYGGLPEDFDHTQCVDNHYNCIPFDQLIGGAQYAVKGLPEVAGVTVNYPAEYICTLCGNKHNVNNN